MFRARTHLLLALALPACASRQPAPIATAPTPAVTADAAPSATPDAAVAVAPAVCPERSRALRDGERVEIVASLDGLREIGADGTALRTLSATPSAMPRYTSDRRAVVFLARGRAEVRRLSLDDCRETTVAALPRGVGARCGGEFGADYDPTEFVQSDDAMGLTADGSALCLHVMDRNLNMMNVEVVMRVALDGATVTQRVTTPDTCETPRVAPGTPPLCETAPIPPRRNTDAQPFAIEGNRIVRRVPRGRSVTVRAFEGSDVNVDEVSSSGRWQVFSANVSEGDTISRDLLLFDAQTGRVHPIVEGAFPPALDAATIRAIRGVHEHTATATGETKISFVDPGERLWVGGLLVIPGERGVAVGGDLAR